MELIRFMAKTKVNFNLDEDLYFELKQLALNERTTVTALLTKWIVEAVEKETNQSKLDVE